jgi:hypothetical protein
VRFESARSRRTPSFQCCRLTSHCLSFVSEHFARPLGEGSALSPTICMPVSPIYAAEDRRVLPNHSAITAAAMRVKHPVADMSERP